jgi:EPS-associated MarR family transcriptional regulator
MNRSNPANDDEGLELAAMRAVTDSPTASQRSLALALGISLGKTNFLLRELLKKGLVKAENFRRSDNKLAYLYLLTPSGVVAKARLTQLYLKRKEAEFAGLQREIEQLRHEIEHHGEPARPTAEPAPKSPP